MTREEIEKDYQVNEDGIITSPGKFEGQMIYVPYFNDQSLNGFFDLAEWIEIENTDLEKFSELEGVFEIRLFEDDNGFVYCQTR